MDWRKELRGEVVDCCGPVFMLACLALLCTGDSLGGGNSGAGWRFEASGTE